MTTEDLGTCQDCEERKAKLIFTASPLDYSHGMSKKLCYRCYLEILVCHQVDVSKAIAETLSKLNEDEILHPVEFRVPVEPKKVLIGNALLAPKDSYFKTKKKKHYMVMKAPERKNAIRYMDGSVIRLLRKDLVAKILELRGQFTTVTVKALLELNDGEKFSYLNENAKFGWAQSYINHLLSTGEIECFGRLSHNKLYHVKRWVSKGDGDIDAMLEEAGEKKIKPHCGSQQEESKR